VTGSQMQDMSERSGSGSGSGTAEGARQSCASARSWTCADCGLTVTDTPMRPDGWWVTSAGWCCLDCRRSRVQAEALADAGLDVTDRRAPSIRRRALIEFELLRQSGGILVEIARIASVSPQRIGAIRNGLVAAGRLRKRVTFAAQADVALLADHTVTNEALASRLGCSIRTVARRRRRLEDEGAIPRTVRKGNARRGGTGRLA
jgi:hypothetical protein